MINICISLFFCVTSRILYKKMLTHKKFFFLIISILIISSIFISKNITKTISPSKDLVTFISFGDNPHVPEIEVENNLKMLINSINDHNPSLVIHVGDTLGGREPCTDSMIDLQRKMINRLNAPVLYTPGDNEWRDCYQDKKGLTFDNQERLAYLRKTYFSNNKSLGKNSINVSNYREEGYPENARVVIDNVAFITAHLVGSNNNYDPKSERNTREYLARDMANIKWINDSFSKYREVSAFVVAIHADMYTEEFLLSTEYKKFGMNLYEISNKYKKPVLILFGDSHKFRDFQPMPKDYPYIYAIENYGNPDLKALMIQVDISKNKPFIIIKVIKGESAITWFIRNSKRVFNYLRRNLNSIFE